jgi:malate synthase
MAKDSHSTNLLNAVHEMQVAVRNFNSDIAQIADTLSEVNMDRLAKRLDVIQQDIDHHWKEVYKAHGEHIAGVSRDTNQATSNMMMALFAGLAVGEKRNPAEDVGVKMFGGGVNKEETPKEE